MTGSEVLHNAFSGLWFEWREKNRKAIKYVKVRGASEFGEDPSNISVIIVDLKKGESSFMRISYYKLFNNCTVVEDEEILKQLIIIEAKLLLQGKK